MNNLEIFEIYESLAGTLTKMLYPIVECSILDYSDPNNTLCHNIFKNKKTTLKGKENIPEIYQKNKIQEKLKSNLVNFCYENKKGKKLKTSAIGIYNNNSLIGCFTIHIEISFFENFVKYINHFINTEENSFIIENQRFDASKIENDMSSVIENYMLENNLINEKIKKTHKKEIIQLLLQKEFLSRKGAITNIANHLSLSRPTVYRYIKEILKSNIHKEQKSKLSETIVSALELEKINS
ncbi:MAG: helix-turn-helix domain-containing protein [bacterium]